MSPHVWRLLVLLITACVEERLEWYPVYPLPGETAVQAERPFALYATGAYTHPPCDEPSRLPRVTLIEPSRGDAIDVRATCESPYLRLAPRQPLRSDTEYELHVTLDARDRWAEPVYSARAAHRDGDAVVAFSTAHRPTIVSAHWSGWLQASGPRRYIAFLMFSQQVTQDLAITLDTGDVPPAVTWHLEKQWFPACDALSDGCDGSYFSRQHIVVVYTLERGPLLVSGTAGDGTRFGPVRVVPE